MRSLSIKHRLILNTAVLVVGLLIILGLNQYQASQQTELGEAQRLNERLVADMLMLRRNEKDFLMRAETRYLATFDSNVSTLQTHLQQLADILEAQQIDRSHLESFRRNIRQYQQGFSKVVAATETLGLTNEDGRTAELLQSANRLDTAASAEARVAIMQLHALRTSFIVNPDPAIRAEFEQQADALNSQLSSSAQPLLTNYQQAFARYARQRELLGVDERSGLMGEMRAAVHQTEVNLEELSEVVEQALASSTQNLSRMILLVFALVLGLVVLFNLLISRSIIRPILSMQSIIQQIAVNKDLSIRLDTAGNDEVSSVAVSFNQMMKDFERVIGNMATASNQLAAASQELSTVSDEVSGIAHNQEEQTAMIATAITEMAAAIQEVAGNALAASEAADKGATEANAGQQSITRNIDSMEQLQGAVTGTSERLQILNERTHEISKVVNVIQDIAEQTNLLALNAAIEAARAGEQGRGFAVVADEVRTLAANTKASTQTIHETTERLLRGAREAMEAMQVSADQASESGNLAAQAGDSFARVYDSIQQVTEMGIQISTATEEQSSVAHDITENVNKVADSVRQVVTGAHQCASSSQELARLAADLQDEVAQFKVS
ncbi:methyl-accepting chemotaxis protein [Aliidiomarina soli]|nr:methyl-accepting chemotaxis protein [Aliidiomarina soli]